MGLVHSANSGVMGRLVRTFCVLLISGFVTWSVAKSEGSALKLASSHESTPVRTQEPKPRALEAIEQACVQCHDLYPVFSRQKTAGQWERTIAEMMWRGAQMLPGEAELIRDYLSSGFLLESADRSPQEASVSGDPQHLPVGDGRELIQQSCVQCHDLSIIIAQRKNAEGWKISVDRMILMGTRLNAGQAQTVVDYLAKSFGR